MQKRDRAEAYPNAQVASAKDVADQISGSLVDASNLSHRLGVALAILAALAAFLLAALLTLSSVGKRVRELGTLKALGWTQRLVVRQVVGESLAQGVARRPARRRARRRSARRDRRVRRRRSPRRRRPAAARAPSGFGALAARTVSDHVALDRADRARPSSLLGFLLALVGGLIAGAAGAFRAARLRPADALRTVE